MELGDGRRKDCRGDRGCNLTRTRHLPQPPSLVIPRYCGRPWPEPDDLPPDELTLPQCPPHASRHAGVFPSPKIPGRMVSPV